MRTQYVSVSKIKLRTIVAMVLLLLFFFVGFKYFSKAPTVKSAVESLSSFVKKVPVIGRYVPVGLLPLSYIQEEVLPKEGYITKISFGNIIPKMVSEGIIDIPKLEENYKNKGGIPGDMRNLLTKASHNPILITKDNSAWLITLLWPFGLSNKMIINEKSPIAGKDVGKFASTGGWTLGKSENGGEYFNKYALLSLSQQQEQRVKKIAENIHRPCCNNSAFFQDCNHGSAALGLVELAVAQGLPDDEIYKTVLKFNSFWFPQNYTETALYFQKIKGKEWNEIDPKLILSKEYSSVEGWMVNVDSIAQKTPGLLPEAQGGGSCSS